MAINMDICMTRDHKILLWIKMIKIFYCNVDKENKALNGSSWDDGDFLD
jgi:hypothetical protein